MKSLFYSILLFRALSAVFGLAVTDSISDADPAQSGYLPNHNMDPAVVNSSAFSILWQKSFNTNELASIATYS
jgi:iron transport multicopper oxidase